MKTKITQLEGIDFVTPNPFEFSFDTIATCPDCCGPGNKLAEKALPETLLGLKVSPACFVHDWCWVIAEPSWTEFHQSNSIFLTNMLEMIRQRPSKIPFVDALRVYIAATYFIGVSIIKGPKLFWDYKKK